MEHIVDYLKKNKDISFKDKPLGAVDALILAQFCYMKWEGLIPGLKDNNPEGISLLEMKEKMDPDYVFMDERYSKDNILLWNEMISGKRYRNMTCNYFCDRMDEDIETQFCAFVVFPEDDIPVVLYRGTDETILGWKEDFNMAFSKPVAGQRLALLYLQQVSLRLGDRFHICGHSKGGNFAVYAAMNVDKKTRDRIERIYDFDGPGFRPEVLKESHYNAIKSKLDKMIPQSSIVGMLLENHEDYSVVKSSSVGGVLQHNPYSWIVSGDEFSWEDDVKKSVRFKNNSLNKYVLGMDEEQIKLLGETVFDVIADSDVDNLLEIIEDPTKYLPKMLKNAEKVESGKKEAFKEAGKTFYEQFVAELKKIFGYQGQKVNFLDKNVDK